MDPTQVLLPKRVVALYRPTGVAVRTLARQIAESWHSPVWLVDTSCDRIPHRCFTGGCRAMKGDGSETFETWLRALFAAKRLDAAHLHAAAGPEDLLEEVAATIRMLLSEHRGLHFLIIGGGGCFGCVRTSATPGCAFCHPSSLFDVPDLSGDGNDGGEIGQVLHALGLPTSRASWLYRQTEGHPWLLYELLAQNIDSEEAAAQVVQYQLERAAA